MYSADHVYVRVYTCTCIYIHTFCEVGRGTGAEERAGMSKTARYQSLTIKRKLEIIDKVDSLPPGKKKKDIAAECGIPASTLSTILKSRESSL